MNKICLLVASLIVLHGAAPLQAASAAALSKRFGSDIDGVDLVVSCKVAPTAADYVAQTGSGVPLSDPYAVSRGPDKGLVSLMSRGGERVKRYAIPRQRIQAVVTVKYDTDGLDRADLIFTPGRLIFVHTATANAGVFTISDVYELPLGRNADADNKALKGDPQLSRLLDLGLWAYRPAKGECKLD